MNSLTNTEKLFNELSSALAESRFVSVRRPRQWQGKGFTTEQEPVAVVTVNARNKPTVFAIVGDFVVRKGLSTITKNGVNDYSDNEILVYVNLNPSKNDLAQGERDAKEEEILLSNAEIRASRKRVAELLNVGVNADGTEFYGVREIDDMAWMCVFHEHSTCIYSECSCDCHD